MHKIFRNAIIGLCASLALVAILEGPAFADSSASLGAYSARTDLGWD
ncbi:hypothetical protein ACFWBI_37180 [Streptomyces sp. NPDC059982]